MDEDVYLLAVLPWNRMLCPANEKLSGSVEDRVTAEQVEDPEDRGD